jgi:hypothetical protein
MEKQGKMSDKLTLEKLYDAGFTNALMQLKTHIGIFIEKPNSQIKQVFQIMDVMLDVIEEEKGEL